MADYVISATIDLKDRLSAGIRSSLAGVRNFRSGCAAAARSVFGLQSDSMRAGSVAEAFGRQSERAARGAEAVSESAGSASRSLGANTVAATGAASALNRTGAASAILKSKTTAMLNAFQRARAAVQRTKTKIKEYQAQLTSAEKSTRSFGGGLTSLLGGFAGIGAAASGINMFKKFDDTMLAVKAKTGAVGDEYTALREKAKELGATTRFSASEAAKGMDYLAMAGYKTNDILGAMPGLLSLAAASGEELGSVADIVSDVMTAFGWAARDTGKFADIMAYAASNSNTSVGMMGESFKYAASVAHSAGVSAQETATALAMMANAGVKGSMGGTALRSSLIRLLKPPKEAADAMAYLGVQAVDSTGNFVGLRSIVAQMTEKTQGMTKAQKASAAAAIFGTEAVSGMMGMINQGPEAFDKFLAGVENSAGAAKTMEMTMNSGVGGAIANMTSALESLVINLGDKLAPTITSMAAAVTDFAILINGCDFNSIISGIGGVAAAFTAFKIASSVQAAGGFLQWLAPAGAAIASISAPILIGAAAVGALVAAGIWLARNWDTLEQKAGVWGVIGGDVKYVVGVIANEVEYVVGVVDNELKYLSSLFGNELAYIGGIVANEFLYVRGVVINEFQYMSGVVKNEVAYWSGVIDNETQYIKDKITEAVNFMSDQIDGVNQFLSEHEGAIKIAAGVLTGIFAPALIKSGVEAAIAGGKIAVEFIANLIATGREAVINGAKVTASFIGSMIQTGTTAVITGAKTTASFVASIAKAGVEAVITSGKITGSLLMSMGRYVVSGWKVAGAIVMQTTAWAVQRIIMLGTALAQNALTLAVGAWTLAGTIASGVTWALGAAFAFLTSPIGLAVLAIAGIVAAGIWMYNHWETVQAFFVSLWESPTAKFLMFATGPIGWIIGAVTAIIVHWDELKAWFVLLWDDPSKAIDQFCGYFKTQLGSVCDWAKKKWSGLKDVLSHPIDTAVNYFSGKGDKPAVDHRATGANFFAGGLTEINERGGEIIDLPRGSRIYPAATTQRMLEAQLNALPKPPIDQVVKVTLPQRTAQPSLSKAAAPPAPKKDIQVFVSGNQFVVREEADISKIAAELAQLMENAALNLGGV